MNKIEIDISKLLPQKRGKIIKAEIDYRKMRKQIEPFVKKREIKRYSTAGKWQASDVEG